ncbi:hypothetical protein [Kitasatospora sp. NPDC056731]|uniref:hypothetical protein n=1 Tax=Kitasatospora sp. NPDC056731 TaxID=3155422 RepID=UPI00341E2501
MPIRPRPVRGTGHGAEQAVVLSGSDHPGNRALYAADIALHRLRGPPPDLDAAAAAALAALGHYATSGRHDRTARP